MAACLAMFLLAATADVHVADRLYSSGAFEQAARAYRELLQRSPRDAKLLVRLGATEYQLNAFSDAETHFRSAAALAPDSEQAAVGLGTSLLALDRGREAVPFLEKAVRLAPSDRMALRALGHAYQSQNDLFKGERVLKALVAEDANDAESWYYLGALLYDNNYYAPALEAFHNVLGLQPSNDRAAVYIAGALAQLGHTEEAGKLYGELIARQSVAQRPELWLGYAQFLFEDQQPKPALEAIDQAISRLPDSPKLEFWRARILFNLGDLPGAEADARKAVELAPELPNAHNLLMKIYRARGGEEAANQQARWLEEHESGKPVTAVR